MKKYRVWAVILPFCLTTALTACVTAEKIPEATENTPNAQMENAQQPAAVEAQPGNSLGPAAAAKAAESQEPPPPPPDPCAATIAQHAEQARRE